MSMSARTVTLARDAYLALDAHKREGESFSEVVRRLTRTDRPLGEFAGAWRDVPPKALREFEHWTAWSDWETRTESRRLAGRLPR